MDRSDLIERLRSAEGPDWSLDAEIHKHFNPERFAESFQNERRAWDETISDEEVLEYTSVPAFTGSVDVVLDLVSERDVGGQQGYLREAMNELSKDHALHVRGWDESDGVYREKLARYVMIALLQAKEASENE